ncbi:transposase probable is891/is1136/is1341 [Trichococcus palustris]|jgi:putative transposase|uniref:Transposase probable is891/is1136/is1341 n=1 Tax=Trichococcus palustris TaxID=140314 RepID=A0A143YC81_9LACT|nr:transposase probable is891/is1136/is1341 [Trichococcus palustris]SFK58364.1 transposase, IS605 OrfB family, central region [Trichococcus palustris]
MIIHKAHKFRLYPSEEQRILIGKTIGCSCFVFNHFLSESKNYQKQRVKVAGIHEQISNARTDYLQKISTEIVKNHDIIGIEDLQVSNLVKNHKLAKAISDSSWSKFRAMLEYKACWYGKQIIAAARNFPSNQLCSGCGYQSKDVNGIARNATPTMTGI